MSLSQLTLGQQQASTTVLNQYPPLGSLLLNEIKYLAIPSLRVSRLSTCLRVLKLRQPSSFPLPVVPVLALTLFCLQAHEPFDAERIQKQIRHWLAVDDVFQTAFLGNVIIISAHEPNDALNRHICNELKHTWPIESCIVVPADHSRPFPAGRPYFWISKSLHAPYRLYDDVQGAFVVAVKPKATKR